MTPATENDLPFDLTPEERTLGYTGLVKKYLEAASEEAVAAGYDRDPVPALLPFDKQTPGQWLQSRGASRAAAELLSSGFGADFGSMASFLHHGLNRRGPGSAGSFKIVGGNEQLPQEFARRVPIRYGTPVLAVNTERYRCARHDPQRRRTADADGGSGGLHAALHRSRQDLR